MRPAGQAEEGDHPGAPPEPALERQAGVGEGGVQGGGEVAAAVPLDPVELGEEVGQGGDGDDHPAAGADEVAEAGDGGAVVVDVLDHVEGEGGVERLGSRLAGPAGRSGRARPASDRGDRADRAPGGRCRRRWRRSPGFERLQGRPPAAADVDHPTGGMDPKIVPAGPASSGSGRATRGGGRRSGRGRRGSPRPCWRRPGRRTSGRSPPVRRRVEPEARAVRGGVDRSGAPRRGGARPQYRRGGPWFRGRSGGRTRR